MKSSIVQKRLSLLLIIIAVFTVGSIVGFLIKTKINEENKAVQLEKKDAYIEFVDNVYELIKTNYWEKLSDEQLADAFAQALEKIIKQPQNLTNKNIDGVNQLYQDTISSILPDKKKEFVSSWVDMVLANLKPFGRSRLYSQKDTSSLNNNVNNVDPQADHYSSLEVPKTATQQDITKAFEIKKKELAPIADKSPEAKQKLDQAQKAYTILSDQANRQIYDISGVEPTIDYKLISPTIFYIHINKFSPTTLDEFQRVSAKVDNQPQVDALILDLRDNIGGAIDQLPYFLGPFIGADNYAYQFFHQDVKIDFKTKTGWSSSLVKYKKVVVLINEGTQSSAEVVASTLKKYNVGVLVGTTSKGWGTVEKVYPIDKQIDPKETFSAFIVNSLTLRDDGQPIEGSGVDPVISIKDKTWGSQLMAYFNTKELVDVVSKLFNQ